MNIDVRALGVEQHEQVVVPILAAFGMSLLPERAAQMKRIPELDVRLGAFDGEALVGGCGAFNFTMTTPGGSVAASGLTIVAVLPTHRRRGVMAAMMRRHLDDARGRGQHVAALWASEGHIYGRFGYGMATECCALSIDRDRSAFAARFDGPDPAARARIVNEDEALRLVPPIWDRVRVETPGMVTRSDVWWEVRRLRDWEPTGNVLQRVVLEIDGRPEGYALYRVGHRWDDTHQVPAGTLRVIEALGATPRATRLIWRYLFDIDLMHRIEAMMLPLGHPLTLLVAEPRRLRLTLSDGMHVRLVDVEAALAARGYGSGDRIVLEVDDAFCPWNTGRYALDGGARRAVRTDAPPDLRLDAAALGAVYLGGVSFRRLADAGWIEERAEGAVERADALFRSARGPWCPEMF